MFSFRQIQYFIAVAETGSVSSAANAVHISQSTLTTAIKQLEDDVCVSLFARHSKGMELTHSGHQFLRQAYQIMSAVDNAKRSLTEATDEVIGALNIGVTSLVSGYYLADLLSGFKKIYGNVELRVFEDDRSYIEHLLVNGELDVGVLLLSSIENHKALNTEVLTYSRYRAWLPPHHPLLLEESISMDQLLREPQILLRVDDLSDQIRSLWRGFSQEPEIAIQSGSVEAVRSLVYAGMGVALMPDMTYRPWSLEGDRVEARQIIDLSDTLDIGLAWRRGGRRNALVEYFVSVAREQLPSASGSALPI
ncbi:MAG: LysR family transcriptional regulator [Marinobacter sp.]|uniref:LysR family transcriptional regulator n=1 Tax=Marinobacter sp. TaxID=50741 RepID=UPI00396D3B00